MVQVWGTGGRRVLGFALASLVPAAAVTLLLVNQPSIADQPVFPLLRLPLAVVALGLALAAVVSWVAARDRLSRPALTGLAMGGRDDAALHRPADSRTRRSSASTPST